MAFDAFIKFDGIDGEATEAKHSKWIDVDSFHWGVSHHVDMVGAAQSSGKAAIESFSFTKLTDSSSPKLALSCCTGEHIKLAEIHFSQSTGDRLVWMSYKFTDVMISGFNISGNPSGVDRPQESISISFSKWEQKYQPTDNKGKLGGAIPAGYDLKANKKV
jgi:type VI secretion system secreted protein Hcp